MVLEATSAPKNTTEYVDQVIEYAPPNFEFRFLNARTAFQRVDVFHVHWPELIVRGRNRFETILRCLGLQVALYLMRARGTAIVRTLHNLEPHEPGIAAERWAISRLDAATDLLVTINPIRGPHEEAIYIPHGHYRGSYEAHKKPEPIEGRIAFAGLIRPYKGVERLITAFQGAETPGLSLRVVGKPTDALRVTIEDAANADPRITACFGYLSDEDFVAEISSAELMCLPYDDVYNSGVLLAVLSLDRPALVKETPSTRALADEVGPGWIHFFSGELNSEDIDRAIRSARATRRAGRPCLEGRDWQRVADQYADAFIEAIRRARQRRRAVWRRR